MYLRFRGMKLCTIHKNCAIKIWKNCWISHKKPSTSKVIRYASAPFEINEICNRHTCC